MNAINMQITQAVSMGDGDRISTLLNELDRTKNYEAHTDLVYEHKPHAKHGPTRGTIRNTATACVTEGMSRDYTRVKHTKGGSGRRNPKYMCSRHVDWEDDDAYDWKMDLLDYDYDEDVEEDERIVWEPMPEWAQKMIGQGFYSYWLPNGRFGGVY